MFGSGLKARLKYEFHFKLKLEKEQINFNILFRSNYLKWGKTQKWISRKDPPNQEVMSQLQKD